MALRLINERDPERILNLTHEAWFSILDLAEEYGWNPVGAVVPGQWRTPEADFSSYFFEDYRRWEGEDEEGRLVVLEDALNLSDALEQAFVEYEPRRLPTSYFLFEPRNKEAFERPSIGALLAVIDIARLGAFWIEPYSRYV